MMGSITKNNEPTKDITIMSQQRAIIIWATWPLLIFIFFLFFSTRFEAKRKKFENPNLPNELKKITISTSTLRKKT
jgi:hypothetical protein